MELSPVFFLIVWPINPKWGREDEIEWWLATGADAEGTGSQRVRGHYVNWIITSPDKSWRVGWEMASGLRGWGQCMGPWARTTLPLPLIRTSVTSLGASPRQSTAGSWSSSKFVAGYLIRFSFDWDYHLPRKILLADDILLMNIFTSLYYR